MTKPFVPEVGTPISVVNGGMNQFTFNDTQNSLLYDANKSLNSLKLKQNHTTSEVMASDDSNFSVTIPLRDLNFAKTNSGAQPQSSERANETLQKEQNNSHNRSVNSRGEAKELSMSGSLKLLNES